MGQFLTTQVQWKDVAGKKTIAESSRNQEMINFVATKFLEFNKNFEIATSELYSVLLDENLPVPLQFTTFINPHIAYQTVRSSTDTLGRLFDLALYEDYGQAIILNNGCVIKEEYEVAPEPIDFVYKLYQQSIKQTLVNRCRISNLRYLLHHITLAEACNKFVQIHETKAIIEGTKRL